MFPPRPVRTRRAATRQRRTCWQSGTSKTFSSTETTNFRQMPYSINFTLARKCSYAEMYFPSPNRIYKQWFFVPCVSEWYFPSWIRQTINVLPNTFIIRATSMFDLFGSSFVSYLWALAGCRPCSWFHRFPQNRFSQKLSPSSLQKSPHSPPPPRRRYPPPPPPLYELRTANITRDGFEPDSNSRTRRLARVFVNSHWLATHTKARLIKNFAKDVFFRGKINYKKLFRKIQKLLLFG